MKLERKTEKLLIIAIIGIIAILTIYKDNFGVKKPNLEKFVNTEITETAEDEPDIDDKLIIHIAGEVVKPGIYEFKEGDRLNDAVEMAGGLTDCAETDKINLALRLEDEMKITIPSIHDDVVGIVTTEDVVSESSNKTNINTATKDELMKLNGIGPKTAEKILEHRESEKFTKIEDIMNINGIGEKMFEGIKDQIKVK